MLSNVNLGCAAFAVIITSTLFAIDWFTGRYPRG